MKKLLLVRHAKSYWGNPSLPDRERPLAARGERDAPRMARRMHANRIFPEKILCSDAIRTLQTAEHFLAVYAKQDPEIEKTADLYHASSGSILQHVRQTPDRIDCLFVFGHNPGLTDLVNSLGERLDNLPTAGVFGFRFATSHWKEIGRKNASFWLYDFPKNESAKTF
ncbi:histidine phosphatase family protein [Cyclobacterium xiamenense]|jgi:phosphohistidine phosphatase|uniref:SixA phosphatase family protein n=1 Tax=Cyclobacterium xiamenense TaxID=1297121 RepID=UPI0035D0C67B